MKFLFGYLAFCYLANLIYLGSYLFFLSIAKRGGKFGHFKISLPQGEKAPYGMVILFLTLAWLASPFTFPYFLWRPVQSLLKWRL